MKILSLKDNECLLDIKSISVDKRDICGFWLYSAVLYNHDKKTKKFVVLALKNRKMYLVGSLIRYSWLNIQKVVDKLIIDYMVDVAKEKAIYKGTKIKGFKRFIKIFKEKVYIPKLENHGNLVLMLKHDYVAFENNVLDCVKRLNSWFLGEN